MNFLSNPHPHFPLLELEDSLDIFNQPSPSSNSDFSTFKKQFHYRDSLESSDSDEDSNYRSNPPSESPSPVLDAAHSVDDEPDPSTSLDSSISRAAEQLEAPPQRILRPRNLLQKPQRYGFFHHYEPNSYKTAISCNESTFWTKAIEDELSSLRRRSHSKKIIFFIFTTSLRTLSTINQM